MHYLQSKGIYPIILKFWYTLNYICKKTNNPEISYLVIFKYYKKIYKNILRYYLN